MQNKIFKGALIGTSVMYVLYQLFTFISFTIYLVQLYNMHVNGEGLMPMNWFVALTRELMCLLSQLLFIGTGIFFAVRYKKNIAAIFGGCMLSLYAFMQIVQEVLKCLSQWIPACEGWMWTLNGEVFSIVMLSLLIVTMLLIAINYKSVGLIIMSVLYGLYRVGMIILLGSLNDLMNLTNLMISRSIILVMLILEIVFLCMWIWNENKKQKLTE
jgi:hypothetical protein